MTPELAAFSDWTLALLPRLFLYPGGLGLLAALLLLRLGSGGVQAISPQALLSDLNRSNLLSIALPWAAIALLPFPGAGSLPSPVDSLALAALPALSLLLDITNVPPAQTFVSAAITLALILPALASSALLPPSDAQSILVAIVVTAVMVGLLVLAGFDNTGLGGQVRWIAWLCLATLLPIRRIVGDNPWPVGMAILLGIVVLSGAVRLVFRRPVPAGEVVPGKSGLLQQRDRILVASVWLLALLGLLWALLAG